MKRRFVTLLGSFFYTGFFPVAPATFASFIWLLVFLFVPGGRVLAGWPALVIALPVSFYCANEMEKYYGRDASPIVIDEFVGMQVSLLLVEPSLLTGVIGFISFRFFDIVKPFPAGASQRLPGGIGVVADDLLAGLYARVVLLILIRVFNIG